MPYDWTPERIEQLRMMWLRGDKTAEIAEWFGVTRNQVIGKVHRQRDLPQRDSPLHTPNRYPWTDELRDSMREMRAQGFGYRRVAKAIGCSEVTALEELRRLGLANDPRPRSKKRMNGNGHKPPPSAKSTPAPRINFGALARSKPSTPIPVIVPLVKYIPPTGGCLFPMWRDDERPTHKYCGKPLETRQYCKEHADRCYVRHPVKNQWTT